MDAVLGTAGHIDHGKTTLVRALTGINCDRLDEEKRRGITIELGFAWLDLPDGRKLGIVDVPGHEKFVKNMVAGATGIDCMLLVIAADEGVMPQTREHLDICALLGVQSGLVVLTKTDMVEDDWLEMVTEDVKSCLQGTFLENAPIFPVSSTSGAGIDALREEIFKLVKTLETRPRSDILRLPVDRVFTLKGFGTVITGTVISGECQQGEEVCIMPSGARARARTLQVHGAQVKQAHSGQRCAINLQGLEVSDINRGDVIARSGTLFPSRRWIARITCLKSSPHPIRQRMESHFHHGSRECAARIVFRDRSELLPGETAIAELHFEQPLVGVYGDHCVLRAHSPLRTIAGGILLDPLPALLRKRDPLFPRRMEIYEKLAGAGEGGQLPEHDPQELVSLVLSLRQAPGVDENRLAILTGLPRESLKKVLENLEKSGEAICWDLDSRGWIGREAFDRSLEQCELRAIELHEREHLKSSFAHKALCSGWGENLPPKYAQKVLDTAVDMGKLQVAGNGLKLASHEIVLNSEQLDLMKRLLEIYDKNAFSPPLLREICEAENVEIKKVLALISHLCEQDKLIKIQDGFYYKKSVFQTILDNVRKWFAEHETLDVADMKNMLDISRKYAIPLLEYMDSNRITVRVGNQRKLLGK